MRISTLKLLALAFAIRATSGEDTGENPEPIEPLKLSQGAQKVLEDEKSLEKAKELEKEIQRKQDELNSEINPSKSDRLHELLSRRNELLIKIASVAKTYRLDHDQRHPREFVFWGLFADLRDNPIILIVKNNSDVGRNASQFAQLEGLKDIFNGIVSPCSVLANTREQNLESEKRNDFSMEQQILDGMEPSKRLNYGTLRCRKCACR
ncbi:hypothetical protein BdWA1_003073 [Babesia duncani]|uniref:Uncharacterized protein n=1 Tax=Babesia duncani TaxID=323732 RepID=A0AAD9PIC9_9APIC|nr:hypothetical protein BdWA1_003073 [Babesia duncani]